MDVFTHFIIGAIIGEIAPKDIKNRHAIGAGFAILPDITNVIFVHPYLGWLAGHTIPFAVSQDFINHPEILQHWTYQIWLFSHGFIFWSLCVLPFWNKHRAAPLSNYLIPFTYFDGFAFAYWRIWSPTILPVPIYF